MENFGIIIALAALALTLFMTIAGVIIWSIRQEGRINLSNRDIESNRKASELADVHLSDRLADAIKALAKFDENTQTQVEEYRRHTDLKIDQLGNSLSAKFEKVFDKLDQKADKP